MLEYKQPTLSVITVTLNCCDVLERTLYSVISQTYFLNIEFIVIDGASEDGTLALLKKYISYITHLVSEKDEGIYDAMNTGIGLATGDYILFLNAGDEFYASNTIERVLKTKPHADIYYGDTLIVDKEGNSLGARRLRPPRQLTERSYLQGMLVCHQAFIVKRPLVPLFDVNYMISADINWCIRCVKRADKDEIINTNIYIAKYLAGGTSWKNQGQALLERFEIMFRHFGFFLTIDAHFMILFRYIKYRLKNRHRTN